MVSGGGGKEEQNVNKIQNRRMYSIDMLQDSSTLI